MIAVITGAYLANEATVVWILVEATTLLASVLIYHEKQNGIRSHMEIHFPLLGGNCLRLYGYPFHRLWH